MLMGFLLKIMKGDDYYNIHRKFQVHSTNIIWFQAKTNIARWKPPPSPNFDSLPYPYPRSSQGRVVIFCPAKMTEKDDPTISFSHLNVELSIQRAGKILKRSLKCAILTC